MSILNNNNNKGKKGNKNANNKAQNTGSFTKPGKTPNVSKKPIKTGGTRGS